MRPGGVQNVLFRTAFALSALCAGSPDAGAAANLTDTRQTVKYREYGSERTAVLELRPHEIVRRWWMMFSFLEWFFVAAFFSILVGIARLCSRLAWKDAK